jgi:hypothetical protein
MVKRIIGISHSVTGSTLLRKIRENVFEVPEV